jgi:hypothetical protein
MLRILADHWPVMLIALGMQIFTTTTFYLITVYTPTFGDLALHLRPLGNLVVTFCVGLTVFILLPIQRRLTGWTQASFWRSCLAARCSASIRSTGHRQRSRNSSAVSH